MLLLTLSVVLLPIAVGAQTNADYHCFPSFITQGVKANILIILDNYGSMNNMAFGYDNQDYYHPDDYDPNVTYYGYFNPAQTDTST